jgi:hypothetical protein
MQFDSTLGRTAGAKSRKPQKHFSTVVKERLSKKATDFADLFILAFERQLALLRKTTESGTPMTSAECREFDALSRITNKALDKLMPSLNELTGPEGTQTIRTIVVPSFKSFEDLKNGMNN